MLRLIIAALLLGAFTLGCGGSDTQTPPAKTPGQSTAAK
jgi:hypothetical protein